MISPQHALEGVYEHKMDAKCRVSVPAEWRIIVGNGDLRLLQSKSHGLSVLRVLTVKEYENYLQEVENQLDVSYLERKVMLGRLHSRVMKTSLNPQGKLLVPKAWCDIPGIFPDESVVMVGRGSSFEIFNPENYKEMIVREEAFTMALNEKLGFF
jgi:MraZ protein